MKNNFIAILCLSLIENISVFAKETHHHSENKPESHHDCNHDCNSHHHHKHKCKKAIFITAKDINTASSKSVMGYEITKPGYYKLCEDVNWKVKSPSSFAITIAANNVSL